MEVTAEDIVSILSGIPCWLKKEITNPVEQPVSLKTFAQYCSVPLNRAKLTYYSSKRLDIPFLVEEHFYIEYKEYYSEVIITYSHRYCDSSFHWTIEHIRMAEWVKRQHCIIS